MYKCCHISCARAAEFEIIDTADFRPDTNYTLACEAHVGELLGHATDLAADVRDEWLVSAL